MSNIEKELIEMIEMIKVSYLLLFLLSFIYRLCILLNFEAMTFVL